MPPIRRSFLVFVLAAVLGTPPAAAQSPAAERVATFQATLLSVMKQAALLGVEGRFEILAPAIADSFNIPLMAEVATGGSWKQAAPDRRRRMAEVFLRMNAATVATLFDGYSGETFRLVGEHEGPNGIVLVETRLESPDGGGHEITYAAKRFGDEWRLVDVIVDGGISELSVRRSEYQNTLETGGLPALIGLLDAKATELLGR